MTALVTITATGLAASVAQIIILRELLVCFHGNELSAGIALSCWLGWHAVGCRLAVKLTNRIPPTQSVLGLLLLLSGILVPAAVFLIRSAGPIWAFSPGETLSLWKMIQVCIGATGIFSPLAGVLFSLCWRYHDSHPSPNKHRRHTSAIFVGESAGAAIGGLIFYITIQHLPVFVSAWMISGVLFLVSAALVRPWRPIHPFRFSQILWMGLSLICLCGIGFSGKMETYSRIRQWGNELVAVKDTAYQNLALTKREKQYSVFSNGLWIFSTQDRPSLEHGIHPALLQHPAPQTVLLIGGDGAGQAEEILKHLSIQRIDYLEADPQLVGFAQSHLPPRTVSLLKHPSIRLIHEDATRFFRIGSPPYDVVLMHMPDPLSAGTNRFYTEEFFRQIKNKLGAKGIFSFSMSGGREMLGEAQLRYLKSVYLTLQAVFNATSFYPGDFFRFFATDRAEPLLETPQEYMDRILSRNLSLSYVRSDTLQDRLDPFRLGYFRSLLASPDMIPINTNFRPTCYANAMILWAAQWTPRLRDAFLWMSTRRAYQLWAVLIPGGLLLCMIFRHRSSPAASVTALNILSAGAATMVLQMVLLIAFQIIAGFLFLQIALIISFFMTGLACGAAIQSWHPSEFSLRRFKQTMVMLGIYPLLIIAVLIFLNGKCRSGISSTFLSGLFSGLSFLAGGLGGSIFSIGIRVMGEIGVKSGTSGGRLYAIDLAGAAIGLLIATFFLLPFYGFIHTLFYTSGVILISVCPFGCLKKRRRY